jgi:hypothetical protein
MQLLRRRWLRNACEQHMLAVVITWAQEHADTPLTLSMPSRFCKNVTVLSSRSRSPDIATMRSKDGRTQHGYSRISTSTNNFYANQNSIISHDMCVWCDDATRIVARIEP